MPSPKWKLVVDIGEVEETTVTGTTGTGTASVPQAASTDAKQEASDPHAARSVTTEVSAATDHRIDEVVTLLGKYMPSDPLSPLAPIVPGFMSLRLLLLRTSRTPEEEEQIKTMLDSYSSYASGGRGASDIAVMLARDFLFLTQQNLAQPPPMQEAAAPSAQPFTDNAMPHVEVPSAAPVAHTDSAAGNLSLFGLPSIRFSPENSPALTPIPAPESIETLSIVSN